MPNGGVLGSGSGMRLQATTPGVGDVGNFHITGKGIVHGFEARPTDQVITAEFWKEVSTYIGNFTAPYVYCLRSVLVGTGDIENVQAVNGNSTSDIVSVGNDNSVWHGTSVAIGNDNTAGAKNPYTVGPNRSPSVAIGNKCLAYGITGTGFAGPTAIGHAARAFNAGFSVVIGDNIRIGADILLEANRSDLNIHIGSGYQTGQCRNTILIDAKYPNPSDPPTCHGDNTIQIGNSTHSQIWIGKYHFTASIPEMAFRQTADKAVTGTTETSLFGAGEGTRALSELVAGSAVRVEGWANVAWPNAGTVKLRLKLGAVVVLETVAIPITAGSTFGTHVQAAIQVRTGGATGAVIGAMSLDSGGIANRVQVQGAAVTVDLTTAQTLDLTAEISNAGDSITSRIASVEVAR